MELITAERFSVLLVGSLVYAECFCSGSTLKPSGKGAGKQPSLTQMLFWHIIEWEVNRQDFHTQTSVKCGNFKPWTKDISRHAIILY